MNTVICDKSTPLSCSKDNTVEETETVLKSAEAVGLKVAGVDIMRSNAGPLILEVNASPGLEGIEGVTKVNVAGAIIAYGESLVRAKK